jgi:hypothetical protein
MLDGTLVPYTFLAVTVHVYGVPFASGETVIGLVVPVPVILPGLQVAV